MRKHLSSSSTRGKIVKRIDDLQYDGLVLIQDSDLYCFTTDAVLLSWFSKCKKHDVVVELCAGTGAISTLINGKYHPEKIIAVEIQKQCCDLFEETKKLNKHDNIEIVNLPLQNLCGTIKNEVADVVIVNPPYYEKEKSKSKNVAIAMSTHEVSVNLDECIKESARLLKFGGKLYMVHHTDRLAEIICKLKEYKLEPKVMQIIQPKPNENANMVLLQAVKCGKVGLKVNAPVVLRDANGEESEQAKVIYNR